MPELQMKKEDTSWFDPEVDLFISAANCRNQFGEVRDAARYDGKRTVVLEHGKPTVAIVSVGDLRKLMLIKKVGLYGMLAARLK